jgi:uncharacterized protein
LRLDKKLLASLCIGFVITLVVTSYTENNNALAQTTGNNSSDNNQQTIQVTGTADATVNPDRVSLSFGVETKEKTAVDALNENDALMKTVLDALQTAGVKQNETQTSFFNIMPVYQNSPMLGGNGNLTGYTVSNNIQVTSSNLQSVSDWIDTAVKAGANRVNGVSFTLSDPKMKDVRNGLIQDALHDAREKADIAASAVGMKVIGVKTMNIYENFGRPQVMNMVMAAPAAAINEGSPVIAGQQQVSTNVNITYLIG